MAVAVASRSWDFTTHILTPRVLSPRGGAGEPRLMIRLRSVAKMAKAVGFEVMETGVFGWMDKRGKPPKTGEQSRLTLYKASAGCLLA